MKVCTGVSESREIVTVHIPVNCNKKTTVNRNAPVFTAGGLFQGKIHVGIKPVFVIIKLAVLVFDSLWNFKDQTALLFLLLVHIAENSNKIGTCHTMCLLHGNCGNGFFRWGSGRCLCGNSRGFGSCFWCLVFLCAAKDDVLTLLIHLGYLAFDWGESAVFIPNAEIRGEFRNAIVGERWKNVVDALEQSDRLLQATWNEASETVAKDGRVYQGICY